MKIFTTFFLLSFAIPLMGKNILVFRKDGQQFAQTSQAFSKELNGIHFVTEQLISKTTTEAEFTKVIQSKRPDLLLLMDNKSVSLAQEFYKKLKNKNQSPIPSISGLALNLRSILKDNIHIAGIAYEVPALSLILKFKHSIATPKAIRRVLTYYRASQFSKTIDLAARQLRREGVELISVNVDKAGSTSQEINNFVQKDLPKQLKNNIDMVWLQSDNIILNRESFQAIWLKAAHESRTPFVCDIEKFATSKIDLCSFAASPVLEDLGRQLANMATTILDDGETPADLGVESVLSIKETLNIPRLKINGLSVIKD